MAILAQITAFLFSLVHYVLLIVLKAVIIVFMVGIRSIGRAIWRHIVYLKSLEMIAMALHLGVIIDACTNMGDWVSVQHTYLIDLLMMPLVLASILSIVHNEPFFIKWVFPFSLLGLLLFIYCSLTIWIQIHLLEQTIACEEEDMDYEKGRDQLNFLCTLSLFITTLMMIDSIITLKSAPRNDLFPWRQTEPSQHFVYCGFDEEGRRYRPTFAIPVAIFEQAVNMCYQPARTLEKRRHQLQQEIFAKQQELENVEKAIMNESKKKIEEARERDKAEKLKRISRPPREEKCRIPHYPKRKARERERDRFNEHWDK